MTRGQKLLLAVSGGADSVALLHAMSHIATRRRWQLHLTVGHVDHHLRDDSQDDATWTQQLAKRLDIPFAQRNLSICQDAGNIEDMARQERYAALIDMAEQHQCTAIVTAHHAVDQLETMLMRLIRGTSLHGLGAMAWSRPITDDITLIRPMLMTDHDMAIDFLHTLKQDWREDHTNSDTTRMRAAIRHTVIPAMLSLRSDLPQQIVTTSDQLQSIDALLQIECDKAVTICRETGKGKADTIAYSRDKLKKLHPAMQKMVLRAILTDAGVSPDRLGAKQLAQFGKMLNDQDGSVRQLTLGQQVRGTLDRNHLTLTPTSCHARPGRCASTSKKDIGLEDC